MDIFGNLEEFTDSFGKLWEFYDGNSNKFDKISFWFIFKPKSASFLISA